MENWISTWLYNTIFIYCFFKERLIWEFYQNVTGNLLNIETAYVTGNLLNIETAYLTLNCGTLGIVGVAVYIFSEIAEIVDLLKLKY